MVSSKNDIQNQYDSITDKITELTKQGAYYITSYGGTIAEITAKGLETVYKEYDALSDTDKASYSVNEDMVSKYIVSINEYKEKLKIYDRLLNESPKPPIIGYDSDGVPILGNCLIVSFINDEASITTKTNDPNLNGVTHNTMESAEDKTTSVFDKEDLDIENDFNAAEQEMIKEENGAPLPYALKIIYE